MDMICSEMQTVFREGSSRKTVTFEEQMMSKDKYLSIFLRKMEAIVLIIFKMFFTTHVVFRTGEYHPDIL